MARRSMRDDVVRAASTVIADRGLAAISLADVAAAAGMHPTSIYRIFRDKFELFDAVLTHALKHTEVLRAEVFASGATPEEMIKATTFSYIQNTAAERIDRKLLFRALVDHDMDTLKRIASHRAGGIGDFVAAIGKVVPPERAWSTYFEITTLSTGLIHFQAFHELLHPEVERRPEQVADRVLGLVVPGVDWPSVRLILKDVVEVA